MNDQAIGFFDSGVGGLSVWRAVLELLPRENTYFLADSAYAPYGTKSREAIRWRCEKNTEQLLEKNVTLIVVACNTATAAAVEHLRARYSVPFIGVEPAIKPAALQTQSRKIAVLATQGTLESTLFEETMQHFRQEVEIFLQEGKGLVEQVEKNALHSPETEHLLRAQLEPIRERNIDFLVLGCTHYPFLKEAISKIVGPDVHILDTAEAVTRQIQRILTQKKLCNTFSKAAWHRILTNGNTVVVEQLIKSFRPPQTQIKHKDF